MKPVIVVVGMQLKRIIYLDFGRELIIQRVIIATIKQYSELGYLAIKL